MLLNLSEANAILASILSEMSGYTEITDQLEAIQLETTKKMQECYKEEQGALEKTTESESETEELTSAILTELKEKREKGEKNQEKNKKPDEGQEGQSVGLKHS